MDEILKESKVIKILYLYNFGKRAGKRVPGAWQFEVIDALKWIKKYLKIGEYEPINDTMISKVNILTNYLNLKGLIGSIAYTKKSFGYSGKYRWDRPLLNGEIDRVDIGDTFLEVINRINELKNSNETK